MKVDFVNSSYRRWYGQNQKEIGQALVDCFSNGDLTLRKAVWDLEADVARFVGRRYGVGVGSGTDALFLSLKALGIGPGDEVITVSNTFIATIQAIVHCGATPILVDVFDDEQMDIGQVALAITPRTKAIIPVHYTGGMAWMSALEMVAKPARIPIVEDACQALGAVQDGRKAGAWGVLGCFSFNTAKLLGGLCDGGMVVTDDRALAEKLALLRNHWNVHQLSVDRNDYPQPAEMGWGWKSRLSNVNAAFLGVKFQKLPWILRRREEVARAYNQGLTGLPVTLPHETPGRVWQEYHLVCDEREKLQAHLAAAEIETLVRDSVPNHKMPGLGLDHFNLPKTEIFATHVMRLPLYPEMSNEEVQYVIKAVQAFYQR